MVDNNVVIYSSNDGLEWHFLGNGIIVDGDGLVLTVGHLILNSKDVEEDGYFKCVSAIDPTIAQTFRKTDFINLQYAEKGFVIQDWGVLRLVGFIGYTTIDISEIPLNEELCILGFNEYEGALSPLITHTILKHRLKCSYMVYGDFPKEISLGHSGSPVFNTEHHLVGLISGAIPYNNQTPSIELRLVSCKYIMDACLRNPLKDLTVSLHDKD